MPVSLSETANEQSTYVVTAAFADEDGTSVTPSAITWTLTDDSGRRIINSRDGVSASPASSVDIVLSGDDLALSGYDDQYRRLTVEATYTSDLGAGLPLKESARFLVSNLAAVE